MPAMHGLESLRNAGRALHNGAPDQREAVRTAAHAFWDAAYYAVEWPATLRCAAESVYPHILLRGSIDRTVDALDAAGLQEARRSILEFCALAERAAAGAASAVDLPAVPGDAAAAGQVR
jgi:hypothetical protein